jgi:AbrB family looped-hinge helix DNA binding protein
LPENPIVAVTKVTDKGMIQIPLEIREKLNLKPGTKLFVVATQDAVVLQKAEVVLTMERPRGIMHRLRSMFSRVPIKNIEE